MGIIYHIPTTVLDFKLDVTASYVKFSAMNVIDKHF